MTFSVLGKLENVDKMFFGIPHGSVLGPVLFPVNNVCGCRTLKILGRDLYDTNFTDKPRMKSCDPVILTEICKF